MSMLQIWLQLLAPLWFGVRALSPSASAANPHIRGHSITSGDLGGLCSLHGYFLSCQVSLYSFQLVITYCSASLLVSYMQASSFVRRSVCPDSVHLSVSLFVSEPTVRSRPLAPLVWLVDWRRGRVGRRGRRPTWSWSWSSVLGGRSGDGDGPRETRQLRGQGPKEGGADRSEPRQADPPSEHTHSELTAQREWPLLKKSGRLLNNNKGMMRNNSFKRCFGISQKEPRPTIP